MNMSSNQCEMEVKRGRPSKPLGLTLEEGGVDVFAALAAQAGAPVRDALADKKKAAEEKKKAKESAKEAARLAKVSEREEKKALAVLAREEKKKANEAAKVSAREEKKKAKESAKEAARLAKVSEREAAAASKALSREAQKKEKAEAKELEKKEKAAAKALEKKEKAAAKALEKGKAKKPAAQLVAALQRADEPVPELQVEGYEEDEEVSVRVFEHNGKRWLRDDGGAIYDPESHDEVGRWDEESQSVVAMKMPTEPRMMCDNA